MASVSVEAHWCADVQWFRTVDKSGDGNIDVKELQQALALGNLHFSLQAVAMMIRLHDRDRSGSIDFNEFQSLHKFLMNMQQAFQYFDRDRSGALDRGEVFSALQHAGAHRTARALALCLQSLKHMMLTHLHISTVGLGGLHTVHARW